MISVRWPPNSSPESLVRLIDRIVARDPLRDVVVDVVRLVRGSSARKPRRMAADTERKR